MNSSKLPVVFSLVLMGLTLVHGISQVEDVAFLEEAAGEYSPALVKSLMLNRIEHKIAQIKVVSSAIGNNKDQMDLCAVILKGFIALKSDIELMDESQVICGDDTYQRTIKGFISQFAYLIETFNSEYEYLRLPNVTTLNPTYLLTLTATITTENLSTARSKVLESITAYRKDLKSKITSNTTLVEPLVHTFDRQLEALSFEVNGLTTSSYSGSITAIFKALNQVIETLRQSLTTFYRQYEVLNSQ